MSNVIQLDQPHVLKCWRCRHEGPVDIYVVARADPETFALVDLPAGEVDCRSAQLCPKCFGLLRDAWAAVVDAMTLGGVS